MKEATHNPAEPCGLKGASASGISTASMMGSSRGLWCRPFALEAIWEAEVIEQTGVEKRAGLD